MKMDFLVNQCKAIALISLLSSSSIALAAGDLMIFPTRIVFDKNRRAAQVDLTNSGTTSGSYRITLTNKHMTELGEFLEAKSPLAGEFFADKIIQYSPRQVELTPGGGQVVRIILRKPADLAPGEYRTHLVFTRLPDVKSQGLDDANKEEKGLSMTLTPLIGVSIPIIIENGELQASAALSGLRLLPVKKDEPPVLEMRLERTGTKSLYGDFVVKFIPKSGSEQIVGLAKGVAVYSPNPTRLMKVVLRADPPESLKKGKIVVLFNESNEAGGKNLAQNSLEIL